MPGHPYVGKLHDGRYFAVELPEGSAERDTITNELILRPVALRLLDRLQTVLSPLPQVVTPGRLRLLRESLNWSEEELANEIGEKVESLRAWEANEARPTGPQREKLEVVRHRIIQLGVPLSVSA